METISEHKLIKLLDERKTSLIDKDLFWIELKNSSNIKRSYSIGEQNLIIDMPNSEQRDRFIKTYSTQNPSYDYFTENIPDEYKDRYKKLDNEDSKYPYFGIPLFIAEIDNISSLKEVYISILDSFCVAKADLRIKNIEEMEHRLFHLIKTLSVEIIIINYTGGKLLPSKKLNSILYSLCRLSELCKISFNILGSVSPKVFYNESRKVPVGCFYHIEGESNSDDIHFVTRRLQLDKSTGKFVEV